MKTITTTEDLAQFCEAAKAQPYVTVDTEFLRERTYYSKLCLIQLALPGKTGDAVLVDPLVKDLSLEPLYDLFRHEPTVKVFHAARQDLEIFFVEGKVFPTPLFDTQVAAMVCGFGEQVGYETLVRKIARESLDKTSRFTDWSHRPLSEAQKTYAIADVTHLRVIYEFLNKELVRTGRHKWVAEELAILTDPETYITRPEDAWTRVKTRTQSGRFLAVVRELARFREDYAQTRNVPRARVFKDDALLELASTRPSTVEELGRSRLLLREGRRADVAEGILSAVKAGMEIKSEDFPKIENGREQIQVDSALADLLRVLLKAKSEGAGVAQKLIATSSDLDVIAAGGREAGGDATDPGEGGDQQEGVGQLGEDVGGVIAAHQLEQAGHARGPRAVHAENDDLARRRPVQVGRTVPRGLRRSGFQGATGGQQFDQPIGAGVEIVAFGKRRRSRDRFAHQVSSPVEDIAQAPFQRRGIGLRPQATRLVGVGHFLAHLDCLPPLLDQGLLAAVSRRNDDAAAGDRFTHDRIPARPATRADVGICGNQQLRSLVGRKTPASHDAYPGGVIDGGQRLEHLAQGALVVAGTDVDDQFDRFAGVEAAPEGLDHAFGRVATEHLGHAEEDEFSARIPLRRHVRMAVLAVDAKRQHLDRNAGASLAEGIRLVFVGHQQQVEAVALLDPGRARAGPFRKRQRNAEATARGCLQLGRCADQGGFGQGRQHATRGQFEAEVVAIEQLWRDRRIGHAQRTRIEAPEQAAGQLAVGMRKAGQSLPEHRAAIILDQPLLPARGETGATLGP